MSQTYVNKSGATQEHNNSTVSGEPDSRLSDSRSSTTAQLAVQRMMANGPQSTTQKVLQNKIHHSSVVQQKTIQFQDSDEAELQETADVSQRMEAASPPNNTGLPDNLKAGIESLSGMSMDHVNVHYNSDKPAQLNAHAYAQGSDIHLAPGQEKHLPHEAWHVVQQAQGRVQPTRQMKQATAINDDQSLEREADFMGQKALGITTQAAPSLASPVASGTTVQRMVGLELEFPIIADGQGALNKAKTDKLAKPGGDEERKALQSESILDKDTTMYTGKGFVISPDHNSRVLPLVTRTPAQGFAKNVLEYIFKPAVETEVEMFTVLDNIFEHVAWVRAATEGFTKRAQLNGDYHVGPLNTGGQKPEELDDHAYSMQVNIGVEAQKITDFFSLYAQASEFTPLREDDGKNEARQHFSECLNQAVIDAIVIEELLRLDLLNDNDAAPYLGLRGIAAIMSLYIRAGAAGIVPGGTIKNFTPVLLKTPISDLVHKSLTPREQEVYAAHANTMLTLALAQARGAEAKTTDKLVSGKQTQSDASIADINPKDFKAPFMVAGKTIAANPVGPVRNPKKDPSVKGPSNRRKGGVFETRLGSGRFGLNEAKLRAKEMFTRVDMLHKTPDSSLPSYGGSDAKRDGSMDKQTEEYQQYLQKELEKTRKQLTAIMESGGSRDERPSRGGASSSSSVTSSSVSVSDGRRDASEIRIEPRTKKSVRPRVLRLEPEKVVKAEPEPSKPVKEIGKEQRREIASSSSRAQHVSPPKQPAPTAQEIVTELEALIADPYWNNAGKGILGIKILPKGVSQLRDILKQRKTWEELLAELVESAATRSGQDSDNRAFATSSLYSLVARANTFTTVAGLRYAISNVQLFFVV